MKVLDLINSNATVSADSSVVTVERDPQLVKVHGRSAANPINKKREALVSVKTSDGKWSYFRYSVRDQKWKTTPRDTYHAGEQDVEVKWHGAVVPAAKPCGCTKKESKKMGSIFDKIFGRFGKADKGAFALSMDGQVAIKRTDGGYACLRGDNELVDVDKFALDADVFFYVPSPVGDIVAHDVVVCGNTVGFVVAVQDGNLNVYVPETEQVIVQKPSTHFLMKSGYVTKVVSPIAPGGGAGGGFNNPLMLLLLLGDKKGDKKDNLLPFLILSGGLGNGGNAGNANGINPLMLLLMCSGEDNKDKLPLLLMMSGALGNGGADGNNAGGINPLMLMLLMGDDDDDKSNLLPLMLMGGGGNLFGGGGNANAPGGINPMMLLLLSGGLGGGDKKDKDSLSSLLPLLLLSGNGGGGIFGNTQPQAAQAN